MSWNRREAVTNLAILGDSPDHKKRIGGLLVETPMDKTYPDKMNYVIVQQDGEEVVLSGSASLGRQLAPSDIGKFVKCEFAGWGKSANGKFKIIDVNVWEGEISDVMKAWPRYAEFSTPKAPARQSKTIPTFEKGYPEPVDTGDDSEDLPF